MAAFFSKLLDKSKQLMDGVDLRVQLAVGSIVLAATGVWVKHINLSRRRAKEAPVLWSWIPIFGSALEFGKRPIEFMIERSKECKEIIGVLLAGQRMFIIHDPSSYQVIFKADPKKLSFDEFAVQVKGNAFGMTKEGAEDLTHDSPARALYNKYLFQDREGEGMVVAMVNKLDKMASEIPTQKTTVNFYEFVSTFAFKGSIAAIFSEDMADIEGLYQSFADYDSKFALSVAGMPMSLFPAALRGREACVRAVGDALPTAKGFIEARVKLYTEAEDGLTSVVMDDIVRLQLAMMWASVSNTMPAAYWTLYFIMLDPAAKSAVLDEIGLVFGPVDANTTRVPTTTQLQALTVLDSAISEALRLMSGSLIMRQVMVDGLELTLASGTTYKFRECDKVGIFPTISHYDPRLFQDPTTYKFDRFLKLPESVEMNGGGRPVKVKPSACFLPFGAGVSYCPGRKFARNEIMTIVYYLMRFFSTEFVDVEEAKKYSRSYEGSRAGLGVFPPVNAGIQVTVTPLI